MSIILPGPSKTLPGFIAGRWEPSAFVSYSTNLEDVALTALLDDARLLVDCWKDIAGEANHSLRLGRFCVALIRSLEYPVLENIVPVPATPEQPWKQLWLPAPTNRPELAAQLWKTTIDIINRLAENGNTREVKEYACSLIEKLKSAHGSGIDLRFLQAAHKNRIPVSCISNKILQFGNGSNSTWLYSSFTEHTSAVAANLSKDKFYCAARLRSAGLPAPDHYKIHTAEQALDAASRIGYPVVLKPTRMEQGHGVVAGIENPNELTAAFEKVKTISKEFLVEKHVNGNDYRLTVFNGELIWAVERVPAGVTGDGIHSIQKLVEIANSDSRRGHGPGALLKMLSLDDEAVGLMIKQGYKPDSIPGKNEFIAFRKAANIAAGGYPLAVFDQVHPDNAELAIAAAEALRLDLAGVDLLIPDIRVSWKTCTAGICEVNAQPNLGVNTGQHIYGEILKKLLNSRYTIPVILIYGAENPSEFVDVVVHGLNKPGLRTACYADSIIKIDGKPTGKRNRSFWDAARTLLTNRQVDLCVLALNDDTFVDTGFPFEYFDIGIIAGKRVDSPTHKRDYEINLNIFLQFSKNMPRSKFFALDDHSSWSKNEMAMLKQSNVTFSSLTKIKRFISENTSFNKPN